MEKKKTKDMKLITYSNISDIYKIYSRKNCHYGLNRISIDLTLIKL